MPPIFEAPAVEERMSVGLRLRRARKEAGLTLAQASDRAGLSRSTIGSIERGEHDLNSVSRRNLLYLPNAFGLSAQAFTSIVRPVYGELLGAAPGTGDDVNSVDVELLVSDYVQVRIPLLRSGIQDGMFSHNSIVASVPSDMSRRSLGALQIDREYIHGVPAGHNLIWSARTATLGELVIVAWNNGLYPAFLLPGGLVEMDVAPSPELPARFRPDSVLGTVEQIIMGGVPTRALS